MDNKDGRTPIVCGPPESPVAVAVETPTQAEAPPVVAQDTNIPQEPTTAEEEPSPKDTLEIDEEVTTPFVQKTVPQQAREQSGSAVVSASLAPQLGSSPKILSRQSIDERKMAVLNELTQTSLGYFNYRGHVDKVRFFRWISEWELISSQAVNGLARRHILQAISAASGVTVTEVAGQPNMLARNLWARNWKEKAVRDGKVVVE